MLRFIPLVLLSGCVITHDPEPIDVNFSKLERNWLEIYHEELIICVDNGDLEGIHFFMQEIINEKRRLSSQQ